MRRLLLTAACLLTALCLPAQRVERFVGQLLTEYPQARLLDIYKSCFQDFMGAEHLVGNKEQARRYLHDELTTTSPDSLLPWRYEYCGPNRHHVRISLRAISEGQISEDELLEAFVESANARRNPSVEKWKKRWNKILQTIEKQKIIIPHFDDDIAFINRVLASGNYAISHSPDYRTAYRPHYRIVSRRLFNKRFKSRLNPGK